LNYASGGGGIYLHVVGSFCLEGKRTRELRWEEIRFRARAPWPWRFARSGLSVCKRERGNTRMETRKESGCRVYKGEALDEIVQAGREHEAVVGVYDEESLRKRQEVRALAIMEGCKTRQLEAKKVKRNKAYWRKVSEEQEESERQIRERLEKLRIRREVQFQKMFEEVTNSNEYTKKVDGMLEYHDAIELRKRKKRFQEWHEKVFSKIQQGISARIERQSQSEHRKMLKKAYSDYLQETNEKDAIFLDIVIESAYDPFEVNRRAIKVDLGSLDDPTKRVLTRYEEESAMMGKGGTEDEPKPTRGMLDVTFWSESKIHSTPHGYFAKLMDPDMQKKKGNSERSANVSTTCASRVTFDHFSFPKNNAGVREEFPKGKRILSSQKKT